MEKIKHSVIVITYNQEHLLPTALNSVFNQSVLPYEVIIGDDCSTDGTWDVIQEYYRKYPDIVKPIRHQHNMGIFQNVNYLRKKPTGDVVSFLSGDDWYEDGIFKAFNDAIAENCIDVRKDNFLLVSNCIYQYPNGKRIVYDNTPFKGKNLFKVKIRYGLDFRDTGISLNLLRTIDDIPLDLGYHADWLYTIDTICKVKDIYFINKAFPVYRVGIGVTTTSRIQILLKSKIEVINRIKEHYIDRLDEYDLGYLKYEEKISNLLLCKSPMNVIDLMKLHKLVMKDNLISKVQKKNMNKLLLLGMRNYILKKMKLYSFLKQLRNKYKNKAVYHLDK